MVNEVYNTVMNWQEFAWKDQGDKWQRPLRLILGNSQLEFVPMDILGQLLRTFKGN